MRGKGFLFGAAANLLTVLLVISAIPGFVELGQPDRIVDCGLLAVTAGLLLGYFIFKFRDANR